jgi:type III secretion protein N (ATPase)
MYPLTTDSLSLGTCAFGRAIGARGEPLDGKAPLRGRRVRTQPRAPLPSERAPIVRPLWTGVRAIDALLTLGRGARVGIFGAPGCGKSTLVESIVAGCSADAVVVALVGERGREAQRWFESCDRRTTVVCATSDRTADERVRAAHVAMAHASALRQRGLHVVLVLDSLARLASALREIAVARGESVGRGGYPPSVFPALARLLEVAGALSVGSITLVATVLSDGDDRDPVSEAARSLLDGHVQLSNQFAHAGRFPAIDVLRSASRTMRQVVQQEHFAAAQRVRRAVATLERTEEARALGIAPADSRTLAIVAAEERIEALLRQDAESYERAPSALSALLQLADTLEVSDHEYQ